MTTVRLAPPSERPLEPPLDASQVAVQSHLFQSTAGHVLVVGEAGSGKTTLAVALAAHAVRSRELSPDQVLVLTASRRAAASVRDRVSAAVDAATAEPLVRTAPSLAWSLLRAAALRGGLPAPTLITGAEQDEVLATLMEGHRRGVGSRPDWTGVVPETATSLPGFRHELRDLIMRAAEAGVEPAALAALGDRHGRPEWRAAAKVYLEYERVMTLRTLPSDQGARYDPASIVSAAADAIRVPHDVPEARSQWRLVVVDDAQDATIATWALLSALADGGARIVLLGNADESVQGYRGAVPHRLAQAARVAPEGLGASVFHLGASHRQHGALAELSRSVADRIGTTGTTSPRLPHGAAADPPVQVIVSRHGAAEVRALAGLLREVHRGGGTPVPWDRMVVIARSRGRAHEIRSALMAVDIPCATMGEGAALHRQGAVAAVLRLMRVAVGSPWTLDAAEAILTSRAIGIDAAGLRRMRRALVEQARSSGEARSAHTLLLDALAEPARFAALGGRDAERAARAARAALAGSVAAQTPGATAGSVMWAVWQTLGVSESWRAAALAGSTVDDADLDAMVAVFRAAEQYSERLPESPPAAFLAYLEGQDFAVDTLAAGATSREALGFETPASAAGREWDVVVIAGLEEGTWPNLRLRDTLFGAAEFADLLAGRSPVGPEGRGGTEARVRAARATVADDESRTFLVALTRATSRVIALVRESDDDRPSRFVSWIDPEGSRRISAADVTGIPDLRAAVVRLRREAEAMPSQDRSGHVAMLARLAASGVPGADPQSWHGAHQASTAQPMFLDGQQVRVSPSRVDRIETCALRAVLEAAGGTPESGSAQLFGTLFHAAAAAHPDGPVDAIEREIDAGWVALGLPDNWISTRARAQASEMAHRFVAYAERATQEGWTVSTEVPFGVDIGLANLSGQADRVHVKDGRAVVVDLKTAATAISQKAADENPQLAMYQVAANHGGFPDVDVAVGAELLYLGGDRASVRTQGAVDDADGVERLGAIVATLSSATFRATVCDDCRTCPVRRSCPAWPEGGQVSAS